jgi:TolB-like protein
MSCEVSTRGRWAMLLIWVVCAAGCAGRGVAVQPPAYSPPAAAISGAPDALPRSEAVRQLTSILSGQIQGKPIHKLAVLDFLDLNGGCNELGRLIAEDLTTALFNPDAYEVLERSRLQQIFKEIGETQSPTPETLRLLTERLGVDAAVVGSVAEVGQNYRINGRVVSTTTISLLGTAGLDMRGDEEVRVLYSKPCRSDDSPSREPEPTSSPSPVASDFVSGLRGEYFNSKDPFSTPDGTANPAVVRVDPTIDFEWSNGAPAGRVQRGNFAARWNGQMLAAEPGIYTFRISAVGKHKLFIDGKLTLDSSKKGGQPVDVRLQQGWHELKIEYVTGWDSRIKLLWAVPGDTDLAPIPSENLRCVSPVR